MNFFISVLGWFLWNWAEVTIKEKQLREDGDPTTVFHIVEFTKQKVYTWVGSAACIPLLLWIGSSKLGLKPLAPLLGHELEWSDFYLLASGPAFEIIIFSIGQINRILKKKASE